MNKSFAMPLEQVKEKAFDYKGTQERECACDGLYA